MTIKQIPPLERKKAHKIDPDSLTAALYWDKIAEESLGDADIPFASNEGVGGTKAADEPPPNVRGKPLPKEEATEGWEVTEEDMAAAQSWVDRAMEEAGFRE